MNKILYSLMALCVIAITCSAFSACEQSEKISTYEDLTKSYVNKSVVLENDIDCQFQTLTPLQCQEFDGNGYTIKNAVIKAKYKYASFFAPDTNKISNVTFDNITVNGSGKCDAIVLSSGGANIDNVHIKNSKISCTQTETNTLYGFYMGGIYGGGNYNSNNNTVRFGGGGGTISNCSVTDTTFTIKKYEGNSTNYVDLYLGAISGGSENVTNCHVSNCSFEVNSSSMYCEPLVGGVLGFSKDQTIENCSSTGNMFKVNAPYYSGGTFSIYSTSTLYCGGIVGKIDDNSNGTTIKYCYSENNTMETISSGNIYVGGLVGYIYNGNVNQCYTRTTSITMTGHKTDNKEEVQRRAGGFAGSMNSCSVSSCFAYNDGKITELTTSSPASVSKAAGFVAGFNNLTITNCATYVAEDSLYSTMLDEFCPVAIDQLTNCYISSELCGNANNCEVLEENFWKSSSSIKSKLMLSSGYWYFPTSGLPCLIFN